MIELDQRAERRDRDQSDKSNDTGEHQRAATRSQRKQGGCTGSPSHLYEAPKTRRGTDDSGIDAEAAGRRVGCDQTAATADEDHRTDHGIGARAGISTVHPIAISPSTPSLRVSRFDKKLPTRKPIGGSDA